MGWFDLGLAVLVTAGLVLVPGFAVSSLLGARGHIAWALAVPAGVTIIVLAALGAPLVGWEWGILPVLGVTAVIAVIAAGLRFAPWFSTSALRLDVRLGRAALLSVIGAVLVLVLQLILVIGAPENISQTFDNIFHLNAIRYALDTGSVSPLTIGSMTSAATGGLPFYPSGWHAVASLVVQLSGVSIPVASNAVMIFFAAFAWPVTILLLTRVLVGSSTPLVTVAAAISVAIPAFPLLLVDYGVLFPYMMSLSMIGVPLALVIAASTRGSWSERWPFAVGAAGSVPAVAIAHPGGLVALLVFTTVVLLVLWVRLLLSHPTMRAKIVSTACAAAYAVVVLAAWYVLRPPIDARSWLPTETVGQAVGEVLTASVWSAPVNLVVAALVIAGLVVCLRRRSVTDWIAVGFFAAAAGLYIVVSGLPYLVQRDLLTGAWYNNAPRLAALLAIAWVPVSAIGGHALWGVLKRGSTKVRSTRVRRLVLAAVAVVVLVVLPQAGSMRQAVASAHGAFATTDDSPLLTSDELALIERLDDEVPEDAVILGSPWTGTALAYAIADREVVMPHTLMDITEEMSVLLDRLDSARPGSAEVCAAIDALDVQYVLDFGTQEINDGEHPYKGLDRLRTSKSVEKVDQVGDAVLYKVVLCG
ncbi:DUF6541 family protein [Microbacterium foliorum]|uniref:DUF6541 family protein n=1 Tax=Microbacterium foliorum TaxID=104336 RepID=UPI001E419664|nr:DUF6541 family protein [Microbacterium foliorum]